MNKKLILVLSTAMLAISSPLHAQVVDYSVVSVPEESDKQFTCITNDNDYVCMPEVKRNSKGVQWYTNRIIGVSPDGKTIGFLSLRDNSANVFIKDLEKLGVSIQRTKRQFVTDFSFSPDGTKICFSEKVAKNFNVYQTDAKQGFVCRQITNGSQDYNPTYSPDMSQIFFARQENRSMSIWSYNIQSNFLSNYSSGLNPCAISNSSIICARSDQQGKSEIWRIDTNTGVEECIVSDVQKSFTSPSVSPDGKWILMTGSSVIGNSVNNRVTEYHNADIYVVRTDGSELTQLTYHAADDLSPAWSSDGSEIYFVSQRGSATKTANIWKMNFNLE